MPTPSIFDFDDEKLELYDPDRIKEFLITEPALYMNHLRIAKHIDSWLEGLAVDDDSKPEDGGYSAALRSVAAHLRQGDWLESGVFLQDGRSATSTRAVR